MKKLIAVSLCLLLSLTLLAGCLKRKPNETDADLSARKVPVYVAQSYTGVLGLTNYTEAWTRQGEISADTARRIYQADEEVRKALDTLADYLQKPKESQTTQQKIGEVVLVFQRLRESNVIKFKSEKSRQILDGVISNALLLLSHIQWESIGGTRKPKDFGGAITETILITADLQARIQRQAGMTAQEAWQEAVLLSGEIESLNKARLGL